jgi:phospholipid-binding lipoprotein MlaA
MMSMVPRGLRNSPLVVVLLAGWVVLGSSTRAAAQETPDPLEGLNRKIYAFNDVVDSWVLRPVAKGYDRVTPQPLQRRIGNVFHNLGTPVGALNQLLQGKPRAGLSDFTRFLVNSTVGVGGIFDVAAANGLPRRSEDFGQTFAVWAGGRQGAFLVVPLRGPATTTHAAGMVLQVLTSPLRLISNPERIFVGAVEAVDARANLLSSERLISGDEYLFIRDAYLQSRQYEINDGRVEDDPFLDDFDE